MLDKASTAKQRTDVCSSQHALQICTHPVFQDAANVLTSIMDNHLVEWLVIGSPDMPVYF